MAQIKCNECGHIFEDNLHACPNCGNPVEVNESDKTSKKGWKVYQILGIIMLFISILYAVNYIWGHILFASCSMVYVPDISDVIMMLYALLFATYAFIFIYLYKH